MVAAVPAAATTYKAELTIMRSGAVAAVTGVMTPACEGRPVVLQYQSGSSWKPIGTAVNEDAGGTIATQFSLAGLKQWTARNYRLAATAAGGCAAATSPTIKFMPGPTSLGKNVTRIRTAGNITPSKKGDRYDQTVGTAQLCTGSDCSAALPLELVGVRGDSTALMAKKPYKVKFVDVVNPGPFGLPKGKRFDLLASYLDHSLLRDKMGLDLGKKLAARGDGFKWSPSTAFTELFFNDLYMGSYLFTEHVKIEPTTKKQKSAPRVDIDKVFGMVLDVDGNALASEDIGFKPKAGSGYNGQVPVIVFKDPDELKKTADGSTDFEGFTEAKRTALKARLTAMEAVMYSNAKAGVGKSFTRAEIEPYIDIASAVDFYLIKEFTKDSDADFYKSQMFFWNPKGVVDADGNPVLKDGDIQYADTNTPFFFGPAWDFDRSAGLKPNSYLTSSNWYMRGTGAYKASHVKHRTHWFVQLTKQAWFRQAIADRWATVKGDFQAVGAADVQAAYSTLSYTQVKNDHSRWPAKRLFAARSKTISGEMAWLARWYTARYNWMNSHI
ncbi:MAG: CotH kinase family protein [Propionicimonas sp.]